MSYAGVPNAETIPILQPNGTTAYRQIVEVEDFRALHEEIHRLTKLVAAMLLTQQQAFKIFINPEEAYKGLDQ